MPVSLCIDGEGVRAAWVERLDDSSQRFPGSVVLGFAFSSGESIAHFHGEGRMLLRAKAYGYRGKTYGGKEVVWWRICGHREKDQQQLGNSVSICSLYFPVRLRHRDEILRAIVVVLGCAIGIAVASSFWK